MCVGRGAQVPEDGLLMGTKPGSIDDIVQSFGPHHGAMHPQSVLLVMQLVFGGGDHKGNWTKHS